ncbi:biotin--protein ligase isoform X2 [Topomyia yanbarensis]|nr:biotin--protein ligase isoform X2 [Topomyia yanbarensis]XP_058824245.1 biotin--protein ligase isoform X2 [Topomyia yanbarensis]
MHTKPPNILVYSRTESIKNELVKTLRTVLQGNTYTVYPITEPQVKAKAWPNSTALLLVHGSIGKGLADVFLDFFLHGGKLFSICCTEILHRIHCCNSSVRGALFTEHLKDLHGVNREVYIEVMSRNSTVFSLTAAKSNGRAVLSQMKLNDVSDSDNKRRLDIFRYVLSTQLDIRITESDTTDKLNCETGFLLGDDQCKTNFLAHINDTTHIPNTLETGGLVLQFYSETNVPVVPTPTFHPIWLNRIPKDFSLSDYFDHLKTFLFGRLAIYLPVVGSSMDIVSTATLGHGFVVIPRQQTNGVGRNNNQWLSPEGCAMFSIQLHVPLSSPLGQRLPLVQHLVAIAIVKAIRESGPGYEQLDVRLKWPNDIYADGVAKLGGSIINSQVQSAEAIVNVGCGLNLSNSTPTVCINDLVQTFNTRNGTNLPLLRYEQVLALIFNEIEKLFNEVQCGNLQYLFDLYYKYWLHQDKPVKMKNEKGSEVTGQIKGIDEYGYLLVMIDNHAKPVCIHPDGNSFDMMNGLIIPKYF